MDFIKGLPELGRFEYMMMVVDPLSKYCHFIDSCHPFQSNRLLNSSCRKSFACMVFPVSQCRILYSLLRDRMRTMFLRVDNTEETIEGKRLICIYDTGLFIQVNVTVTT